MSAQRGEKTGFARYRDSEARTRLGYGNSRPCFNHRWRQHRANNSAIYTEAYVHTHIVVPIYTEAYLYRGLCSVHCMPKPTSSWRHWRHLLFQTTSRARWDATHADATQGTSIESQTSNVGTCSSTVYGFLVELSARSTRRHTWNPRANNSCKMRPNPKTRKT